MSNGQSGGPYFSPLKNRYVWIPELPGVGGDINRGLTPGVPTATPSCYSEPVVDVAAAPKVRPRCLRNHLFEGARDDITAD